MYLILSVSASCEIEDVTKLENTKTAEEFIMILMNEHILTQSDVIVMQFLLQETNCEELERECVEYAKQWEAMYYFETPPGNILYNTLIAYIVF